MRLLNRPLAFILAAALAAASIIVMIEVTAFHFNSGPLLLHWTTWYHWAGKTHWDQLVVQVWSAILIVAGALILALELKPPRVTRLPLRSGDDATDAAVTRRGLAGTLRAAATGVDGISSAAVRVRRRRARVTAVSGRPGTARRRRAQRTSHPSAARPPGRPGPAPSAAPHGARHRTEPLMHADRTNRVALTLFGLLVLIAGAAGMTASTGVFGAAFSKRTLFANRVSTYIGHHGTWVWAAAAGVCLLIALAALRWIVALLISTDRAGDIPIPVSYP